MILIELFNICRVFASKSEFLIIYDGFVGKSRQNDEKITLAYSIDKKNWNRKVLLHTMSLNYSLLVFYP